MACKMAETSTFTVPAGQAITVKLINTVNFGPAQLHRFMAPPVPGMDTHPSNPSFSFLLEHSSGRKLVFDLGIRKDYQNYAPKIAEYIPTTNYKIEVTKNVIDILEEEGIQGEDIEAVVWRQVLLVLLLAWEANNGILTVQIVIGTGTILEILLRSHIQPT
jgi:hypothetical protein